MSDADDEDRTIADIRAYQRGRLIRSAPVRTTMTDTPKHYRVTNEFDYTWVPEMSTHGIEGMGFESRDEAIAAAESHRAAVVADSPELAQAWVDLDRLRTIAAEAMLEGNEGTDWYTALRDIADAEHLRERDGLSVLVEELEAERGVMAGELAQARERIAALRGEIVRLQGEFYEALGRISGLATERDAALARVRELEAERPEIIKRWVMEKERAKVLEASAQPKPRDESGPPPGWRLWWREGDQQTRKNLARADRAMRDAPDGIYTIAEAWRIYDDEHGSAPPDEAAIRADERRRLAKELHRMAVEETEFDQRSAGLHEAAMFVERLRTDALAPAPEDT